MSHFSLKRIAPAVLFFALCSTVSSAAFAQSTNAFTINGSVALASEYRFRGLSLSNKDTALQGSLSLSHKSGFYLSTWSSSIESFNGAELELDIYGGYAGQVGDISTNVGFYAYTYPGATANTDYYEIYGSIGGTLQATNWTLGSNYAFDQDGTGGQDNIYIYLNTTTPIGSTPFSFQGNLAYENGAFGTNKWDWLIGVSYSFKQLLFSVNYIDTANSGSRLGSGGVIGMISSSF